MKLEWIFEEFEYVGNPVCFHFYYEGQFASLGDYAAFYFYQTGKLIEAVFDQTGKSIGTTEYIPTESIPIPGRWMYAEHNNNRYLLFSDNVGFDIDKKTFIYSLNSELKAIHYAKFGGEYHLEYDDFVFDDYRIAHESTKKFACYHSDEHLWDLKIQAYLYTNVQRFSDTVAFGTSGCGGHFYLIDLPSGRVKADVNTKGTSKFLYVDGNFYVLSCDKDGKILKISEDGTVEEELALSGKFDGTCSPLGLVNGKIYALSFKKKKGVFSLVLHCISYE